MRVNTRESAMESLQDCTISQLKEVLRKLKLSTSGNKAELMARIEADPVGSRWKEIIFGEEDDEETEHSVERSDDAAINVEQTGNRNQAITEVSDPISRELDWIRRERDLLEREKEILKREREIMRISPTQTSEQNRMQSNINFKAISDLLNDFTGVDQNFAKWERQVHLLRDTYELDDKTIKIIIISHLKGRAYS